MGSMSNVISGTLDSWIMYESKVNYGGYRHGSGGWNELCGFQGQCLEMWEGEDDFLLRGSDVDIRDAEIAKLRAVHKAIQHHSE